MVPDALDPLGLNLLYPDPLVSSVRRAGSPTSERALTSADVRPKDRDQEDGSSRKRSSDRPSSLDYGDYPDRSRDQHGYYSSRHRSSSGSQDSRRFQDRQDVSRYSRSDADRDLQGRHERRH